jgi:iron complex outermembrane receptor protein
MRPLINLLPPALALASFASAQPFPPSPSQTNAPDSRRNPDNEEVVILEEYHVSAQSRTDGYIASELVGATRNKEDALNLPFNVQVITDEFMHDFNLFGNEEVLGFVSAATVGAIGGNSTVRGFRPAYARDGFAFANAATMVTRSNTLQSEFIKGPQSALYGRAAPGGIINYSSRRPTLKPKYSFNASIDTVGSYHASFTASGPLVANKLYYFVNYEYNHKESYVDFYYSNTRQLGVTFIYKITRDTAITATIELQPQDGNTNPINVNLYREGGAYDRVNNPYVTPRAPYTSQQRGWHGLPFFNPGGPDPILDIDYYAATILLEHNINRVWKFRAFAQGYIKDTRRPAWFNATYYYSVTDPDPDNGILEGIIFAERRPRLLDQQDRYLLFQADLLGTVRTGDTTHKFLFAADYLDERLENLDKRATDQQLAAIPATMRYIDIANPDWRSLSSVLPGGFDSLGLIYTNYLRKDMNAGALASYRILLPGNKAVAMLSIRHDWNDTSQVERAPAGANDDVPPGKSEKTTYSLGFNYHLLGDALLAYANGGTSFIAMKTIDGGTGQYVPPETAIGYEAGIKGLLFNHTLGYTIAAFDLKKQNVATLNPDYTTGGDKPRYLLAGEESARGVEFNITYKIIKGLTLLANAAYIDSKNVATDNPYALGRPLLYSAKWNGSCAIRYIFPKNILNGLKTGISANYRGSIIANYADRTGTAFEEFDMPALALYNAFISYDWKWGRVATTIQLNISNLTDEQVYTYQGRLNPQREFTLSYKLSF